jgi:hypothetical protein
MNSHDSVGSGVAGVSGLGIDVVVTRAEIIARDVTLTRDVATAVVVSTAIGASQL